MRNSRIGEWVEDKLRWLHSLEQEWALVRTNPRGAAGSPVWLCSMCLASAEAVDKGGPPDPRLPDEGSTKPKVIPSWLRGSAALTTWYPASLLKRSFTSTVKPVTRAFTKGQMTGDKARAFRLEHCHRRGDPRGLSPGGGSITLPSAVTGVVVGLSYDWHWLSAKLAYGVSAGSPISLRKRVSMVADPLQDHPGRSPVRP